MWLMKNSVGLVQTKLFAWVWEVEELYLYFANKAWLRSYILFGLVQKRAILYGALFIQICLHGHHYDYPPMD